MGNDRCKIFAAPGVSGTSEEYLSYGFAEESD